jgi:hypothetical protein
MPLSLSVRLSCRAAFALPLWAAVATALAAAFTAAAAGDVPLAHIAADQFPDLKTKAFNGNFALEGAAGNAVIRSRYGGDDGGDGEKIYVMGYQVDLTNAYEVAGEAGVSAVSFDLAKAPAIVTWPKIPGDVKFYVIDETGGDKAIPLTSASLDGGKITFTFATPVTAGKTPGTGTHSQWFGFVTSTKPGRGQATVTAAGQTVKPPATPSTAAGGKPADNQTATAAIAGDAAQIDVFVPVGEQPGTSKKNGNQTNTDQKNGSQTGN